MKTPKLKPAPLKVECLECGRKFQTRSTLPTCPKCGGVDVDLRMPEGVPNTLRPPIAPTGPVYCSTRPEGPCVFHKDGGDPGEPCPSAWQSPDPEEVAEGARELSWRHPEARSR